MQFLTLFTLFFSILLAFSISVTADEESGVLDRHIGLSLIDENGHADIPDNYVEIGYEAFYESNLSSVTIPNSVQIIGNGAFAWANLQRIDIPDSVVSIGDNAFHDYYKTIQQITLPGSLTSIGINALRDIEGEIYLIDPLEANADIHDFPSNASIFACESRDSDYNPINCREAFQGIARTKLNRIDTLALIDENGHADIPDNYVEISYEAFYESNLSSVTIPNSVQIIGDAAFAWVNLQRIDIPDSVVSIGDNAFHDYYKTIQQITLPGSLTSIGINALRDIEGEIYLIDPLEANADIHDFPSNASIFACESRDSDYNPINCREAFQGITRTKLDNPAALSLIDENGHAILPSSLKTIAQHAFFEANVSSITLPDTIEIIEYEAFFRSSLEQINLPDSIEVISSGAFANTNVSNINIPNSISHIHEHTFKETNIDDIELPMSIVYVGYQAFYDTNITALYLPNTLIEIGDEAFNTVKELYVSSPVGDNFNFNAFHPDLNIILCEATNSDIAFCPETDPNDTVANLDDLCPDTSGISSISTEIDAQPDIESLQFCITFEDSVPTLNFVIDVSDNFSDTTDLGLLFWPEGGFQTWTGLSRQTSESAFKGSISLHPNALSATYAIRAITLTDNFGASLYLNEGELNSLGFNTTTLLDNPNSDSIPPEIVSFDSSGWSIDENGIPQLEAIIRVTDEHSGLVNESPILELLSPSGKSIQHRGVLIAENEYKFNVSLPEQAASGVYPVNTIRVFDNAGNSSHGSLWLSENPTSFTLDNPNSDNEMPVINEFFLSASFDNITDRPVIHVDGVASDNLSGVDSVYLRLSRPDGRLDRWLTSRQENNNLAFNNLIPLTTGFTPGKYVVDYLRLIDKAGNQTYFSETDLVELGEDSIPEINIFFPDEIEIEEPNLDIYYSDDSDLDNSSVTDSYVVSSWASVNAQWPGILETELITLTFDGFTEELSNFPINFSSSSNAAGYDFAGIGCDIASLVGTQCGIPENPAQTQIVYVSNIVENGTKRIITIAYASDNPQTTGLGLNIHFDSTQANLIDASIALQNAYVGGTAERDFLFGANASNDQINAGGGDDYIYTGDGDDIVQAGEGNDLIVGGSGLGDDTYEGGEGIDTVSYTSAISPITVDLSQNIAYGLDIGEDQLNGIENIIAGQGNDTLILNETDNIVHAGSGDDEIINNSISGTDVVYGEIGNDTFRWSSSIDGTLTIFGGQGADIFKPENAISLGSVILEDFSSEEGDLIDLSDYWENNTHDAIDQIIGDDLSNYLAIENSALVFKLNNITQETILAFSNDIQLEAINTWVDSDGDGIADAEDDDSLDADIGTQPSQLISVAGNPVGVNGHSTKISISYDTSDGDNLLPGIGFRLHYSSQILSFTGTENTVSNDIIVDGDGPYQDDSNFDNDLNTDKYIIFGWAALNGDWPNLSLPVSLVDVVFNVSWEALDQASITTPINFSKVSTTEGYNFEATNYTLNVLPATWDFDGNGQADALTDGLILLRYLFGVSGSSLTDGVMSPNSTMMPSEVEVAVEKAQVIADVDGDGNVDALTDALVVLRYMFGLRDEILVSDVIAADASRSSAEDISQHIELYMP